jgi:hypothetical protein
VFAKPQQVIEHQQLSMMEAVQHKKFLQQHGVAKTSPTYQQKVVATGDYIQQQSSQV